MYDLVTPFSSGATLWDNSFHDIHNLKFCYILNINFWLLRTLNESPALLHRI